SYHRLPRHQVFVRLPAAHNRVAGPVHQRLGGPRPRVVVRRHREAVGPGTHQSEQVTFRYRWQRAVLGEEIAGFADRPHHVGGLHHRRRAGFVHRADLVVGVVERRPDEVVHGRVHDDEALGLGRLAVEHPRQEDAGVAHDRSPWLDDHGDAELARQRYQYARVVFVAGRLLVTVADAETTAQIEIADRDATLAQRLGQRSEAGARVGERRRLGELRADVHLDAEHLHA